MKKHPIAISLAFLISVISVCALLIVTPSVSVAASPSPDEKIAQGQEISLKFCQTCHEYQGTEQAGSVAPPLLGMKSRFPDRKKLYDIIYDPQVALKPHTMMPPFGRNKLLKEDEIQKVIDFLYTL